VIEAATISNVQQGNTRGIIIKNVVVTSPMTSKDGVANGDYNMFGLTCEKMKKEDKNFYCKN